VLQIDCKGHFAVDACRANGPVPRKQPLCALLSVAAEPVHYMTSRRAQMDRILKEERNYILQMVKKIRASGANVLLIQKSILRDAVTDLSLHYLVRSDFVCSGASYAGGALQHQSLS